VIYFFAEHGSLNYGCSPQLNAKLCLTHTRMLRLVLNPFAPAVRNNPKTKADLGSDPIAKKIGILRVESVGTQCAMKFSQLDGKGSVDTPLCPGFWFACKGTTRGLTRG
jgi:hypothetical protein